MASDSASERARVWIELYIQGYQTGVTGGVRFKRKTGPWRPTRESTMECARASCTAGFCKGVDRPRCIVCGLSQVPMTEDDSTPTPFCTRGPEIDRPFWRINPKYLAPFHRYMLDADTDSFQGLGNTLSSHKIFTDTDSTHLYICSICIYNLDKDDKRPKKSRSKASKANQKNVDDQKNSAAERNWKNFQDLHAMNLLFEKGLASGMRKSIVTIMQDREDFYESRDMIIKYIDETAELVEQSNPGELDNKRAHYLNVLLLLAGWVTGRFEIPLPLPDTMHLTNLIDRTVLNKPKPGWEPGLAAAWEDCLPAAVQQQLKMLKTKPGHFRIFLDPPAAGRRSRELIFAQKPSKPDDPGLYKVTLRYFIESEEKEVERLKEILFLQSVTIDAERHTKDLKTATALPMKAKVDLVAEKFKEQNDDKDFYEHFKNEECKILEKNLASVDKDEQETRVAYVGAFVEVSDGEGGSIDRGVPVALISVKYGGDELELELQDGKEAQKRSKLHIPGDDPNKPGKVLNNCVYVDSVFCAKSMAGVRSLSGEKTDGGLSLATEMLRFVVSTSPPESNYVYFLTSKENKPMQRAGENAGFDLVGTKSDIYGKANGTRWLEYQYLYTKKISVTDK